MKIYRCQDSTITPNAETTATFYLTDLQGDEGTLVQGCLAQGFSKTTEKRQFTTILAPVEPIAVLAIGLNYRKHAAELNLPIPQYPVVFTKFLNSITGPDTAIRIPQGQLKVQKADYEAEFAVVLGRPCLNASPEEALKAIAGYTCANDVSARDWQLERSGGQWSRGKSFDTFLPLGPCLVTPDSLPTPHALRIGTRLNGVTVQDSLTSDMIFSLGEIISFLSQDTTLLPGTVIITGTPEGIGASRQPPLFLQPGDQVEVEIEGIGVLRNFVV